MKEKAFFIIFKEGSVAKNCLRHKSAPSFSLTSLTNTRFQSWHGHYAFQQKFSVGGASWTLDPNNEAVNCKTKHTSNKFTA